MEDLVPQGLDLDWELLNHLHDPEAVDRLRAEAITEELVEDEWSAKVFRWAMTHTRTYGRPPTREVLEDEFDEIGLEDPKTEVDDLIGRLRRRYIDNTGQEALEELVDEYETNPYELPEAIRRVGNELLAHTRKRGDLFTVADYDRSIERYHKLAMAGPGPSFGFDELDDHFHGQRGLTFVLGAPKSMKTWFTMHSIIANVARGRRVAFFSLELPAHEADARIRCMAGDVSWSKWLKGALSKDEIETLRAVSEVMEESGLYHLWHPDHGERQVDQMVEQAESIQADIIYFDQLQYCELERGGSIGSRNDTGCYWEVTERMRDYSDKLPIWCVHQFNRSIAFADEMPSMEQIKGSAAIAETGTLALGLWSNKEMRSEGRVQLGTLASRNHEWLKWALRARFRHGCSLVMDGEIDDEE